MAASTKRRPTKAAVAVKRTPSASATALRQRALELAVQSSAVAVSHHYGAAGLSYTQMPSVSTARQYESEASILKAAKAFLAFMLDE